MPLFSSSRPGIRARVLPKFPARVLGGDGIEVVKENGTYTFNWDISGFGEITSISAGDADNILIALWNEDTGVYSKMAFDNLVSAVSSNFGAALAAINALTPAADQGIYFTSASAASLFSFPAFSRALVANSTAATWQTTLGVREVLTATRNYYVRANLGTCSISIASPGVVTKTGHGLIANDPVVFSYSADPVATTMTIATPAVATRTGHGFAAGQPVVFETTGALPTGVTAGTTYYVISAGLTTDSFEFSASVGGAAINTSGTQSGSHRSYKTGALPTGLTVGTVYYVISAGLTTDTFRVSTSIGGSAVNTSGTQTGTPNVSTGNDSNDGLSATRDHAFLTIQEAWEFVSQRLDCNANQVNINLADSVYTSTLSASNGTVGVSSFAPLIIVGNITYPKNVSFQCAASTGCFEFGLGGVGFPIVATIRGVEMKNSVNAGIQVWGGGTSIFLEKVEFGTCAGAQVAAQHQGQVGIMGTTYAVTGNATYGLAAISGGQIYTDTGTTLTYYNAPAYTFNFYANGSGSNIYCGGMTFNGSATVTGIRYVSDENATIDPDIQVLATAESYIPGSTTGIISRGGVFTVKPLPIADGGTNAVTLAAAQANFGYFPIIGGYATNVNFNSVGDTTIALTCPTTNFRIAAFGITNTGTTASLTTAQYGVFTASGGGGTALVASGTVMSGLTSNAANTATSLLIAASATVAYFNLTQVFFRITQAQGAAASGNVYVFIQPLP